MNPPAQQIDAHFIIQIIATTLSYSIAELLLRLLGVINGGVTGRRRTNLLMM
jgi:hypothetical protein